MYTYERIYKPTQYKYDVSQSITEDAIKYTFLSEGEKNIFKIIQYRFLGELNGKKLFNFGFGDYNFENGTIEDQVTSDNGDAYKVFNTVLGTVPRFFEIYNDAIMVVKGSDSAPEYIDKCRISCIRNCADICRNAHRRINIYRGFINKHYDRLKMDYTFYGELDVVDNDFLMTNYEPDNKHQSIVLMKNKNQHYMKAEENETLEVNEPTSKEEMMALYLERTKDSDVDLFYESNERMRAHFRGLILRDQERQARKLID